ncbi:MULTISPECIES: cell division protein FtsQ/DivIB [unclassified Agarivorans]|uniref:cell division protein FtsQ/DivIB n=1 Tax=unclassified Agarivorans TaxID=2636026 RepID=UPI0026E3D6FB|nr:MULTISPECIES: cell division protein FtsQ/DivIB [unclassified Agarivorans]MDO6686913.1 cell division protein FtsQ/DivIB [Agarivorans sp. 3_MG-2023]MDO6716710.1 cell division protein FtsQ/DivIB [Agarivorans sp. 2_MG-2023]
MMTLSDQQKQQTDYWAGVVFFVLVLLSLAYGVYSVYNSVSDKQLSPMNRLLVSGKRDYVLDNELQESLAALPEAGNFFSLNVSEVKQQLELLPWVKQVTVRKQWPDKLSIALREQQVVARWNNAALLNKQGQIFEAPQQRVVNKLATLSGPDEQAGAVLTTFEQLQRVLQRHQLIIVGLALNERHAWQVELAGGMVLKLGKEDKLNRIERFVAVYPQLKQDAVEYIDLRYDTGFAVGWKKQEGLVANDQSNG